MALINMVKSSTQIKKKKSVVALLEAWFEVEEVSLLANLIVAGMQKKCSSFVGKSHILFCFACSVLTKSCINNGYLGV